MNSLTDLREVVDVVIGVETHVHTTPRPWSLLRLVVSSTRSPSMQQPRAMPSWWSSRTTTPCCERGRSKDRWSWRRPESSPAGVLGNRHRAGPPEAGRARGGAKSDPLDAIRAAREAMARPRLGTPRTGGERQALSVLLAARRSAISTSTEAQQQVFSLVIAAPEPVRVRFRGQKACRHAQHRREPAVHSSWDTETISTVVALRTLAVARTRC